MKHRSMRPVLVAVMALVIAALVTPGVAVGQSVPPDCDLSPSGISCVYRSSGSFVVPAGVTKIFVEAAGEPGEAGQTGQWTVGCAAGPGGSGGSGGDAAKVSATIGVSSGQAFHVDVGTDLAGGSGGNGLSMRAELCSEDADPYGGDGGAGGDGAGLQDSSGYILVAAGGGGGGGGASFDGRGGVGGNPGANGSNGQGPFAPGGAGGTGGNQVSFPGQGGGGGGGSLGAGGGGGGGGYRGGGGASGSNGEGGGGGGGGGTNLVPGGATVSTSAIAPYVVIAYTVDSTPPNTSIELSPAAPTGDNGWYRVGAGQGEPQVSVQAVDDDVVAETRCDLDPVGVSAFFDLAPACPFLDAPFTIFADGERTVFAASKDAAGNIEALKTRVVKIDNTLPTISAAATTQPNSAGWYKAPVSVSYTCHDATSGVWIEEHPCPGDHVISNEGTQLTSPSEQTVDRAGNVSDPSNVVTVKIDLTPPTKTGGPTTQPNQAGWYRDDVYMAFDCHDGLSGLPELTQLACSLLFPISNEGVNTFVASTVVDRAGNESAPLEFTIRIDKTPPVVSTPAPITVSATSPAGAVVNYNSGANDNLDPFPAVVCTPASGGVFPIGTTTVTCEATDDAGNSATKQFTVKVLSAAEQLDLLQTAATGIGSGASLADKVKQIQKAVDAGRTRQACTGLDEFLNMVSSQAGKGKLTGAQAASLTAQANTIKATLNC